MLHFSQIGQKLIVARIQRRIIKKLGAIILFETKNSDTMLFYVLAAILIGVYSFVGEVEAFYMEDRVYTNS